MGCSYNFLRKLEEKNKKMAVAVLKNIHLALSYEHLKTGKKGCFLVILKLQICAAGEEGAEEAENLYRDSLFTVE